MGAKSIVRLTRNVTVVGSSPIKGPRYFLEQETLPYCLVLGYYRNGLGRNFTIKLNLLEGLIED